MTKQRPRRPTIPAGGVVISTRTPAYVVKWHRVLAWSRESMLGDLTYLAPPDSRVSGWRGTWVYDDRDDEEAYARGILLSELPDIVRCPDRSFGGVRRVSIRYFTWVVDELGAFEPRWITTGWGMSACGAQNRHRRWIRDYAYAINHGVESRKLVATAMEIVFWTADKSTNYV